MTIGDADVMKTSVKLAVLMFGLSAALLPFNPATAQPPSSADATLNARLWHQMQLENAMNVGKVLPTGIVVQDAAGKSVDLRQVLHGPVVLLKVATDCPPCVKMLDWIRGHAAEYEKTEGATIAVLFIRSADTPQPKELPPDVIVLHTSSYLADGFLGGLLTPAEFFFDKQFKLIDRRSGYNKDIGQKLQFPADVQNASTTARD